MSLFRANNRLAEDPTTLLIDDPEDFDLFRERKQHGIRVIAYDIDLTPEIRQAAIDFGKAQLAQWETVHQGNTPTNLSDFGTFFRTSASPTPQTSELTSKFREHSVLIPEILFAPLTLVATSSVCAGISSGRLLKMGLRVNSSFPKDFHKHEPAAALSLNQNGTEYRTLEERTIRPEAGRLVIFDETVKHRAAQIPEEIIAESPRVNALD